MKFFSFSVFGWPPDKNRSIPLYINHNVSCLICPDRQVLRQSQFLVVVHTRPSGLEARMAIRNSWGRYLENPAIQHLASIIYIVTKFKLVSQLKFKFLENSLLSKDTNLSETFWFEIKIIFKCILR